MARHPAFEVDCGRIVRVCRAHEPWEIYGPHRVSSNIIFKSLINFTYVSILIIPQANLISPNRTASIFEK